MKARNENYEYDLLLQESGLSSWIGQQLKFLGAIDPWLICLIVTIVVCFFTECSSNTATASLFVPILAELVSGLRYSGIL